MCAAMNGHSTYSPEPSAVASRITPGPSTLRSGKGSGRSLIGIGPRTLLGMSGENRSSPDERSSTAVAMSASSRRRGLTRRPGASRQAPSLSSVSVVHSVGGSGMPSRSRSRLRARLRLAGHEHLVEAGRGRDRLEVAEQAGEQLPGVLAAGQPLDVDGEVEVPDVLRPRPRRSARSRGRRRSPTARRRAPRPAARARSPCSRRAAPRRRPRPGRWSGTPCSSTPQPSGIVRPSSRALKILLTATWLVAMSVSQIPSGVGAAIAIGLVPSAWPMPP